MKLLISLFSTFLFLICMNLQAQGLYQKGTVTYKNSKSTEAYVQMDYKYPQRFQNSITYITPSPYAKYLKKGKIKGSKIIKLKPKEIEGFHLDNGQIFKTVSYADITGKAIKMMPTKSYAWNNLPVVKLTSINCTPERQEQFHMNWQIM